jgi:hypothetical protein
VHVVGLRPERLNDRRASEAELPIFQPGDRPDGFERLTRYSRPDARVLLVCQKKSVFDAVDDWAGPKRPQLQPGGGLPKIDATSHGTQM